MQTPLKSMQGWQATFNGHHWEHDLIDRLKRHGYLQWGAPPSLLPEPYFVHQCRDMFQSIYKTPLTLDLYIYHPWKHPEGLIIEGKYQENSGSVDEKFPYVIENLRQTGKRCILMLLGGGARKEAVQWCLEQQDDKLGVMTSWDEWTRLLNNGLL